MALVQPTVFEPGPLITPIEIPAADTLIFTSTAGEKGTKVEEILLVNTSGSPVLVKVTHGTLAEANALCWEFRVPGDGLPRNLLEKVGAHYMAAAEVIRASADTAGGVSMHMSGIRMN